MLANQAIPEFTFTPRLQSVDRKQIRISAIEGITGLKDISSEFDNPLNNTEIELLISFLSRKYNFLLCDDVFYYIINVLKFSQNSLKKY